MDGHPPQPHYRTNTTPHHPPLRQSPAATISMLGSCFAVSIAEKLAHYGLSCLANPTGIVYHPLAASRILQRLLKGDSYTSADLIEHDGTWISLDHHGSFSAKNPEIALASINTAFIKGRQALLESDILILTFGTAWGYWHTGTQCWAANCHRLPADQFQRRLVRAPELLATWLPLLQELSRLRQNRPCILTVSPVRHLRDNPTANQVSKAQLLTLAWDLCEAEPSVSYFPAYEIMIDDLRDYRFYAADMVHPSPLAIHHIWDEFRKWCYTPEIVDYCDRWEALHKRQSHRHHDPDSPGTLDFIAKTESMLQDFLQTYPFATSPSH